jgi:hypothetical protein
MDLIDAQAVIFSNYVIAIQSGKLISSTTFPINIHYEVLATRISDLKQVSRDEP